MIDIVVILDRSGSMEEAKSDHEGGLKSFVEDQKSLSGDVRFTLVQFDAIDPCEIVYDRVRLEDVTKISLIPRGGTPLYDAIGKATAHLMAKQKELSAVQTICMIITDGEENASREWSLSLVRGRIKLLEASGWGFLFLGANIDAFGAGNALGVAAAGTMAFMNEPGSVNSMYSALSSNTLRTRARSASFMGASMSKEDLESSMGFDAAQRKDVKDDTKGAK